MNHAPNSRRELFFGRFSVFFTFALIYTETGLVRLATLHTLLRMIRRKKMGPLVPIPTSGAARGSSQTSHILVRSIFLSKFGRICLIGRDPPFPYVLLSSRFVVEISKTLDLA